VGAVRAKIDAALEGAEPPPTGSGKSTADKLETHDINARPSRGRAGSDTATAIAVAVPVPPTVHPTTWRKSAPRRAVQFPCDCCATVWAFKRTHGLTPSQAYKREHWPMLAAWEESRMEDYQRLSKERAALEKVRRDALAYCIDCHNPLLATEYGFQFCTYERADRAAAPSYGQHEKVKQSLQTLSFEGSNSATTFPLAVTVQRRRRRNQPLSLARSSRFDRTITRRL